MSLNYKNIGLLLSFNTINVVLSIINSTLMVYFFGTSAEVEAFFAASVLGTAVSRFVQTGQLVEIIIPRYHKVKQEESPQAARSIIATLCNFMVAAASVMVIVFMLAGQWVVNWLVPGFNPSVQQHVLEIFYWTGFLMPIQIATNLFQGLLTTENVYGKAEMTNTVSLVITIVILLVWGQNGNVYALISSLVASVVLQFVTVAYYLRQLGYRHSFQWRNPHFSPRELLRATSATTFYMVGVQIYTFLFNAALSMLPAGTFAIYRYVEIIYGKVANIFMLPISTVFFNDINQFIVQNKTEQVRSYVSKNLNFSYFLSLALFLPFWAGGSYFIWVLWGGSKFDATDAQKVYELLCVFFFGLVLLGPYMLFRKLAVSATKPDLQYYLWGVTQVCSGGIGYSLIRWWGFEGIMIQTIIHSMLMSAVPICTIFWLKKNFFGWYSPTEVLKITAGLGVSLLLGIGLQLFWQPFSYYTKLADLGISMVLALLPVLLYLGCSLWLKVAEIQLIREKIGKKWNNQWAKSRPS
ncbi:MAG: hypothetical protein MUE30_02560 [Spirosomaceae bacterium]|nr:hypothetical protein [Spirosomataceae bacterium]